MLTEVCNLSLTGLVRDDGVLVELLGIWKIVYTRRRAKRYSHNKVSLQLAQKGCLIKLETFE